MGSELLYLKKRAGFHRRMAREATCGEARCAHEAFLRAYLDRIERWMSLSRRERAEQGGGTRASASVTPIAAKPEPVR